ncbi:MAG: TIGR02281 family clan AA aspartic protease [Pseudomonadota bacterium]
MLRWAFRYLLIIIVAGGTFAAVQGRDWAPLVVAARDVAVGAARHYGEGGGAEEGGDLEQIIYAGSHGHFLVEAVINGVPIDFMVDTGASHVVLALQDARKLGFTPERLHFDQKFQSANGTVRAASVELRELRIGQLRLFDLEASVNGGPLPISLLGMSFLRRLQGYEVARDRLILRW